VQSSDPERAKQMAARIGDATLRESTLRNVSGAGAGSPGGVSTFRWSGPAGQTVWYEGNGGYMNVSVQSDSGRQR
jgi:hypothetical protein